MRPKQIVLHFNVGQNLNVRVGISDEVTPFYYLVYKKWGFKIRRINISLKVSSTYHQIVVSGYGFGNYLKQDEKNIHFLAHKYSHKVTLTIYQTTSWSFQKGCHIHGHFLGVDDFMIYHLHVIKKQPYMIPSLSVTAM